MGSIFDALPDGQIIAEKDFSDALSKSTINKRFLLSFSFELTPVCNFKCEFCYIRMTPDELKQSGNSVLPFEVWRNYTDQFVEMGVLNCTLTGGECTLHPDFCKIYNYIYDKGCLITVMTNGSNITDEILELFVKKPPHRMYITIYGVSTETYERLCGNGKYYSKVYENIDRLLDKKMPVILQFTAGKNNLSDFEACYYYSKQKNVDFRYANYLINFNKCDETVINDFHGDSNEFLHISKKIWCDKHHVEYSNIDDVIMPSDTIVPTTDNTIIEKGIPCNAGRNTCHINWKGEMQPCVVFDAFIEYPLEKGIKECWKNLVAWADEVPRIIECQNCIHRLHCKSCIANHYSDTGEFGKPSPRMCYRLLYPEKATQAEARYLETKKLKQKKR